VAADVPIVPVVDFWSDAGSISLDKIKAVVAGQDGTYAKAAYLTGSERAIEQALGFIRAGGPGGEPFEADGAGLEAALADGALGLVPLPNVTPRMHAVAVGGISLFGNNRVSSLETWPLKARMQVPAYEWNQSATWTLVAGGDILLDRGVANQVTNLDKGVDFPWDGGTAVITGHHCCTSLGWPVVEYKQTGHDGIVRQLFKGADLSMANLEGPVRKDFTFHEHGLTFTGDPRLLDGLQNAGLDFASLANNHIANGGLPGLHDTMAALDERGIAHAGAGDDLKAAAAPAFLEAGGVTVAVVSCTQMASGMAAAADEAGTQKCSSPSVVAAITEARTRADVVIVFPHWGVEYRTAPTSGQRDWAQAWIDAGADLILGSHPHWVETIEDHDGAFVFYCLGNLVFDQIWSENTMEGLIVELTFQGSRLVQVDLHPTLILSQAQPNLLEFDGGGETVIDRIREASPTLGN
jgi:hypothetical protein